MLTVEASGLVDWDPYKGIFPNFLHFLLLTTAKPKVRGLDKALQVNGYTDIRFAYWSPERSDPEPNHLPLSALIYEKGKNVVSAAVQELSTKARIKNVNMPGLFAVTDTHPSVATSGEQSFNHLTKPPADLSYANLVDFAHHKWAKLPAALPVTVKLSTAYVLMKPDLSLVHQTPIIDSVYVTYERNPLSNREDVEGYFEYLHKHRFDGLTQAEFIVELSRIAGANMNEYTREYASQRGIDSWVTSDLSCPNHINDAELLKYMGAMAITPALVGKIAEVARRVVA